MCGVVVCVVCECEQCVVWCGVVYVCTCGMCVHGVCVCVCVHVC